MDKIGGSSRVREELSTALAEGRGVTAKIRWLSRADEDGRNRWIHCTPLIGSNGQIGVWMVVLIDDDQENSRRWRQAPPVANTQRGAVYGNLHGGSVGSTDSIGGKQYRGGPSEHLSRMNHPERKGAQASSVRSGSPNSVHI